MQTLDTFISAHRISMKVEPADNNPNIADDDWAKVATHWKCTILGPRHRKMTVHFSQGSAISGEPSAAFVLNCLASDAWDGGSFEDWCDMYGYSPDSRKAEKTFKAIQRQTLGLQRILGNDLFEELVHNTERL